MYNSRCQPPAAITALHAVPNYFNWRDTASNAYYEFILWINYIITGTLAVICLQYHPVIMMPGVIKRVNVPWPTGVGRTRVQLLCIYRQNIYNKTFIYINLHVSWNVRALELTHTHIHITNLWYVKNKWYTHPMHLWYDDVMGNRTLWSNADTQAWTYENEQLIASHIYVCIYTSDTRSETCKKDNRISIQRT